MLVTHAPDWAGAHGTGRGVYRSETNAKDLLLSFSPSFFLSFSNGLWIFHPHIPQWTLFILFLKCFSFLFFSCCCCCCGLRWRWATCWWAMMFGMLSLALPLPLPGLITNRYAMRHPTVDGRTDKRTDVCVAFVLDHHTTQHNWWVRSSQSPEVPHAGGGGTVSECESKAGR